MKWTLKVVGGGVLVGVSVGRDVAVGETVRGGVGVEDGLVGSNMAVGVALAWVGVTVSVVGVAVFSWSWLPPPPQERRTVAASRIRQARGSRLIVGLPSAMWGTGTGWRASVSEVLPC
jgi:hypothetical protein